MTTNKFWGLGTYWSWFQVLSDFRVAIFISYTHQSDASSKDYQLSHHGTKGFNSPAIKPIMNK